MEHYIIATQDTELRKQLRAITGECVIADSFNLCVLAVYGPHIVGLVTKGIKHAKIN